MADLLLKRSAPVVEVEADPVVVVGVKPSRRPAKTRQQAATEPA
jgi:hypothetical protein